MSAKFILAIVVLKPNTFPETNRGNQYFLQEHRLNAPVLVKGCPVKGFKQNMLVTTFPFICFISFATAGSLVNLNFLLEFMRRFPLRHVLVLTDTGSGES